MPHIEDKRQVSGWEWHPQPLTGKCTNAGKIVTVRLLASVERDKGYTVRYNHLSHETSRHPTQELSWQRQFYMF